MHQSMLYALSRIILGRNGRRISALGDIRTAYTLLFADYYRANPHLSIQTYYKYAKREKPYPQSLGVHYAGDKGYHRTLGDLLCLLTTPPALPSCTRLILMYTNGLPPISHRIPHNH